MRKGFTLLELVFVIVIMGILSMFGTELILKTYENYVYSNTLNRLSSQSEMAVKQIANRLQYRIKDSTVARISNSATDTAVPIGSITGNEYVLEWIGTDIDGWRGTGAPEWSGFIDLDDTDTNATQLSTPGTQYTSESGAIFFIGSDVDLTSNFGWDANITDQTAAMHPVSFTTVGTKPFIVSARTGDFSSAVGGVYEFYQFSQSAYAVYLNDTTHKLYFYSEYKPWDGEEMSDGEENLIMENVSSFTFIALGDILVIQVCTSVTEESEYAICKEKTVF